MTFRWTEEHIKEFEKRRERWEEEGKITTHQIAVGQELKRSSMARDKNKNPKMKIRSHLEIMLEDQMKSAGIQRPETEYRPILERKWRLDFAWVNLVRPGGIVESAMLGVEVQGMVHRIKGRFKKDIEKRAELMLRGWRILEVDGDSIRDGRAANWIRRLLQC